MSTVLLFLGGVVLGLLLAMSINSRITHQSLSAAISKDSQSHWDVAHHTPPHTDTIHEANVTTPTLENSNAKSFRQQHTQDPEATILEKPKLESITPDNSMPRTSSGSQNTQVKPKNKWVPGREGAFLSSTAQGSTLEQVVIDKEYTNGNVEIDSLNSMNENSAKTGNDATIEYASTDRSERRRGKRRNRRQRMDGGLGDATGAVAAPNNAITPYYKQITANEIVVENENKEKCLILFTYSMKNNQIFNASVERVVVPYSELSAHLKAIDNEMKSSNDGFSSESHSLSDTSLVYYPYPPLIDYHDQSLLKALDPPYVPSVSMTKAYKETLKALLANNGIELQPSQKELQSYDQQPWSRRRVNTLTIFRQYISKAMPQMQLQRADYEADNLKMHLCNGVFEAYSASYLTTKEHMIEVKSEKYNLSFVNCEMASFIHMRESENFYKNRQGKGLIMQTLDVLDFSAIHLSAFERSSNKHRHALWTSKSDLQTKWKDIQAVKDTSEALRLRIATKDQYYSKEALRTVVVMPFLGGAMGAGHSELGNRFEYLKACFWSFYQYIPNIVAGVTRIEDVHWGMNVSGLPFYEMILIDNLPKSASLPVATTQAVKAKLLSGEWDFDYVFFTESDQILISRQLPMLYRHLQAHPSHMLLPHRLMPYSHRVISEVHKKPVSASRLHGVSSPRGDLLDGDIFHVSTYNNDLSRHFATLSRNESGLNEWMVQSCCLPRQNCIERKTWAPLQDPRVPVINYYGLYVPLGNVNFLREHYRPCTLSKYIEDYCP